MRRSKTTKPQNWGITPQEKLALRNGQLLSWQDTLRQFQKLSRRGQSIELRLLETGELQTDPPSEDTAEEFILINSANLYCRIRGVVRCATQDYVPIHAVLQGKHFLLSAHNGMYHFSSRKRPVSGLTRFAVAYRVNGKIYLIVADNRFRRHIISAVFEADQDVWNVACLTILGILRWDDPEKAELLSVWLDDSVEGGD